MEEDDDVPQLSPETMKAFQEFLLERAETEAKIKEIVKKRSFKQVPDFGEDWQLSQFWYSEETAIALAKVAAKMAGSEGRIALISCPTLYKHIKSLYPNSKVTLLEYDQRFAAYGEDFVPYDYKSPLDVPQELSSQFDLVLMDPPFLSNECLTKTAVVAKLLTKRNIVLCTGAVMEEFARQILDVEKCSFKPKHHNNLANEFCCYSNFNFDEILSSV